MEVNTGADSNGNTSDPSAREGGGGGGREGEGRGSGRGDDSSAVVVLHLSEGKPLKRKAFLEIRDYCSPFP